MSLFMIQVCNDLNQCSCDPGFTGDDCNSRVTGGGGGCGYFIKYTGVLHTYVTVDGGWTQWSSWSSCSATCGVGSRTRTRNCTDPAPQGDGADCVGASSGTESCNIVACPGDLWEC